MSFARRPVAPIACVLMFAMTAPAFAGPALVANDAPTPALTTWSSRSFTIDSETLGETRRIFIALPPSHERTQRPYPLVIALDGEWMFPNALLAGEHLAGTGQMPEFVLAGVENTQREDNFTPPGIALPGAKEGGGEFLQFLDRELIPELQRQFRAGKPIVLVGHSHSAMFAAWALTEKPGRFDWAVGLDAPLHHANALLARKVEERLQERSDGAPPFRLISLEARFGWPDAVWKRVQTAIPADCVVQREKLSAETHESMPLLGAYVGLQRIFDDFSYRHTRNDRPESVLDRYARVAAAYGADVPPPERVLNSAIEDFLIESRPRDAAELLTKLVAAYGNKPQHGRLRARIDEMKELPPPKETVATLLATPRASASEIAPFVGEWRGGDRVGDQVSGEMRLRLRVENGVAAGEAVFNPIEGEELVMPLEYVVVQPTGLHFGYINGMRPRGLLVYEMELKDGRLVGEMKMRGVNFTPPLGFERPKIVTELERGG